MTDWSITEGFCGLQGKQRSYIIDVDLLCPKTAQNKVKVSHGGAATQRMNDYKATLSWHSTTPTPTSSPTSSRGSSRECRRVVQLARGITSGNRACRTCRRGSSRGCPCRCRCRRRGMPAIGHFRWLYGNAADHWFYFMLQQGASY